MEIPLGNIQKETDTESEKKYLLSTLLANFSTLLVYLAPKSNFNVSNTFFVKNGPNFRALENFLDKWLLMGKNHPNFVYPK